MVDLSSVRDAPILEGVTAEEIAELEAIARIDATVTGARLFARGEDAKRFYIVKDGAYSLSLPLRRFDDVSELAVEEKGTGEALGWSALVAPHRSIYSCYCTAEGHLFSFGRGDLTRLMSLDSGLGTRISINLNRLIADRLRFLQGLWIEEIEQSTSRVERWSHTEIADHLNVALHPPRKKPALGKRFFRRGGGQFPTAGH